MKIAAACLGKLTPSQFLERYWQKRPLLIRGAFPGFADPVTRDELAGLACEKEVSSRLIMERGGRKPWQVTSGPQRADQLRKLPRSHWTLLVQGVDRFIPGVASLLEPFRFIPDWRLDDVMISFAPRGGTVGPHVDNYDVFLLQGQGRRRWRLDRHASLELRPGLDLRILKNFRADADWILEPGDMLYLPPGVAHYGVALEECLTYSIGFRAPSEMNVLAALQERLTHADAVPLFYTDPDLRVSRRTGEIAPRALKRLRALLENSLRRLDPESFADLMGGLLTEPKGLAAHPTGLSRHTLVSRLKKGASLARIPGSRILFIRKGKAIDLFVNGTRFPLNPGMTFAAFLLTEKNPILFQDVVPHRRHKEFIPLLQAAMAAGALELKR